MDGGWNWSRTFMDGLKGTEQCFSSLPDGTNIDPKCLIYVKHANAYGIHEGTDSFVTSSRSKMV